jgi:hypothetical protein
MRIAYYAPLNAPIDGVPSGDRRVARLYLQALRASAVVELVSTFSSFDAAAMCSARNHCANRRAIAASPREALGFCRCRSTAAAVAHLHLSTAPDWLGPSVSRRLDIAYVVA